MGYIMSNDVVPAALVVLSWARRVAGVEVARTHVMRANRAFELRVLFRKQLAVNNPDTGVVRCAEAMISVIRRSCYPGCLNGGYFIRSGIVAVVLDQIS
eukprot:9403810-Pyramimonas_sp.AAC.1